MLFSRELVGGNSFPTVRKKPTGDQALHSKSWFNFPFGSFGSKAFGQHNRSGLAIYPIAASDNESLTPHGGPAGVASAPKEVSQVSDFEEPERHERHPSASDDVESQSMKRFSSPQHMSFSHMSLSHSSKGPSWIEKPTPTSSFRVGGIMAGVATAGLVPSFIWHGKKSKRQEEIDIAAVIAKLEHQKAETTRLSDLRMNHDDPGLLIERAKSPPSASSSAKLPAAGAVAPDVDRTPGSNAGNGRGGDEELGVLNDIESAEFSAVMDSLHPADGDDLEMGRQDDGGDNSGIATKSRAR